MIHSAHTLNSLIIEREYSPRTLTRLMEVFGYASLDEVNADKDLANVLAFVEVENIQVSKFLFDVLQHTRENK